MKNEKRQQAQNLYFQTNLSKTEIASQLGLNRRTIMLWCQEGNWDNLKKSARHMPSLVAEKCYYLIDRFTSRLLMDETAVANLSHKDALAINMLASAIKKLKNRSASNEAMEMFNFFLENVKKRSPEMAAQVQPYIEDYVKSRKDVNTADFLLEEFTDNGYLPYPEKEIKEQWQDKKDTAAFEKELEAAGNYDQVIANWQNEGPGAPSHSEAA
jgi:hypothetical protein